MRAVILAAGEGTRLRPYTADRPKCLVPLGGRPLLAWQLDALRAAGITDVTVVTGYRGEMIDEPGVHTVVNDRFASTNMVASLMCAREQLDGSDDVVIAYGDIVYEPRLVTALAGFAAPVTVVVDREWRELWDLRMEDPLADAETLRVRDGRLVELGRTPSSFADIEGQYVGLIGVRADFAPQLVAVHDALDPAGTFEGRSRDAMFMTAFLQHLIDAGVEVRPAFVDRGWIEIDTTDDLTVYEDLLARGRLGERVVLGGR